MRVLSTNDETFLEQARSIFASPEVLVVVRYVYGAGSREFWILKNFADFQSRVRELRQRDSVVIMKSFEKVKDGVVDKAFIEAAAIAYEEGKYWVLIGRDNFEHTGDFAYAASESEVREELHDRLGNHVCVVEEPNYASEDNSIGAYVPDEDGIVRPGAY